MTACTCAACGQVHEVPPPVDWTHYDVDHLERQAEWSRETFGPGRRTKGLLDHISRELREIEAKPDDISEWADLLILAFDGAWRHGHSAADIIRAVKDKQSVNEARTWPDWRERSEDEAIEHGRKPRCYIAGPIAGTTGAQQRFTDAMGTAEALGYEPINPFNVTPAKHDGECPPGYSPGEGKHDHTSSACYMRADLAALLTCDAIHMLPGWENSRGATVEHTIATALGLPITYAGGAA